MQKIELAKAPVGPFPAMIVGATANEKPTYTTVGAGGCACLEPVLCVSLKNTHYITEWIARTGFFSVNIPGTALVRELDCCGMVSGRDADKSRLFTSFYDARGNAPMIGECALNFLCEVCKSTEIRGFTMFFGDILAAFASESCVTDGMPDPIKADPIVMIGQSYCGLKSVVGKPFSCDPAGLLL
jgi:flavin reductase (DIM6/NTAB) family NADH-FMN oxidoreductase RutF